MICESMIRRFVAHTVIAERFQSLPLWGRWIASEAQQAG